MVLEDELVPEVRIELTTYPLPRGCATTTLLRHPSGFARWRAAIAHQYVQGKSGQTAMSTKATDREKRRAAALRQNLKRRKAAAQSLPSAVPSTTAPAHSETLLHRPNTAKKPH